MKYTEEDLAGLTDEERAALLEDDEHEGDDDAGAGDGAEDAGAGDDDGQDDDDAGDDQGDDEAGGDADDAGAQGDDAGGDDQSGDEGDDAGQAAAAQGAAPILVAEAPEKAQERLQEIADEKKTLRKQYDEGEITFEDYESKVESLDDERLELKLALNTAETAAKIAQQQEINAREAEINGFLAEVDIPRDPNDQRFRHLDNAVRAVAALPENQDKSAREILQEAYDLCVFKKQLEPKQAQQNQQPAKPPAKPAAAPRKPAPPTLAKVPAAAQTGAEDGSRFAYLDRLDPVAREAAFAKLSPADQDAYLQQA